MRNYNLDWIRVIAMTGVITDHYTSLFNCNWLRNIGLQIGGGNVTIFFMISALLFGSKWAKDGYKSIDVIPFLKKRLLRIYIPMWILILAVVPIEWWLLGRFEPTIIIANAVGAGWARPFGISGHLWYITMMMMLYVGFIIFSHFRLDKIRWYVWVSVLALFLVGYYALQDKLTTFSKAGPLLFIYFGALMFAKGNELMEFAKKNKSIVLISAIIVLSLSMYVYILGWHDTHKAMAVVSFVLAGFLSFVTMYSYMNITKGNKLMNWLSSISYEVYLVHMPIIPLTGLVAKNPYLHLSIGLVLTIILAVGLNRIVNRIVEFIK